jgi:hypothetical protein
MALSVGMALSLIAAGVASSAGPDSPAALTIAVHPGYPGASLNVAFITSPVVINGGSLPTSGGAFSAFTFSNLPIGSVSAATLAQYDTVVLNVASPGMGCLINNLSASQKADITAFVAGGGKLIIYDSECTEGGSVDYSWLVYPFATVNPGATGASGGVLTITEENALSSTAPADPHYINTTAIVNQTDAVGDMNVVNLATVDPHWCLDMTGTNVLNFSGAVHMYARHGLGLFIYNGLDVDYISSAVGPSGGGQLAKIWLQELETGSSPAELPCGISVIGINLTPPTAVNQVGTNHTVLANVTDIQGNPQPGVAVTFTVLGGPNAGSGGVCSIPACTTDATGMVSFTYLGAGGIGIDTIQACFVNSSSATICSATVTSEWIDTGCTPTAVANLGGGCGAPAPMLGLSLPMQGELLTMHVGSSAPNAQILLAVQWAPFGLAADLAPPCAVMVDVMNPATLLTDQFFTDGSGEWSGTVLYDPPADLSGVSIRVQAAVASIGGPLPWVMLSDTLEGVVGTCPPCTVSREAWIDLSDPRGVMFMDHFMDVFPNYMEIGIFQQPGSPLPPNGLQFTGDTTGRDALHQFLANLPPIVPPLPFTPIQGDLTNPTMSALGCSGSMTRYAAVLQMNIAFNAAGYLANLPSQPPFGSMIYVKPGDFLSGYSVAQILDEAQHVLSGVHPLPPGHTCGTFVDLLESLSLSYDGCVPTNWAQTHLVVQ